MIECFFMFLFNVMLPSVDVYTDISLVICWYIDGHSNYASVMSIPPLLNLGITSYKCWTTEKTRGRKLVWLILLLQFYPQWKALIVISLFWNRNSKAHQKKKEMLKEIGSLEPLIESAPTTIIMTLIWLPVLFRSGNYFHEYQSTNAICKYQYIDQDTKNACAVFNGFGGPAWFFTSYTISLFASALGITRFMQIGPCSILSNKGLLKWKFVMAYLSVVFSLIAKALYGAILMFFGKLLIGVVGQNTIDTEGVPINVEEFGVTMKNSSVEARVNSSIVVFASIFVGLNVVPHILFALINVALSTGYSKKMIRVIFGYPSILAVPIFTYFSIGPNELSCCKRFDQNVSKHQLVFSKKLTLINMALTVILYVLASVVLWHVKNNFYTELVPEVSIDEIEGMAVFFFFPIVFLSILFTMIFLALDMTCCCSKSQKCYCTCCCGPTCYELRRVCISTKLDNDGLEVIELSNRYEL